MHDSPKSQKEIDDMKDVLCASVIGRLMYAMVCTRPDISQLVGLLSRFMEN